MRLKGDAAVLPPGKFLTYLLHAGGGTLSCLREFQAARRWVQQNRFRFKYELRSLVEQWENLA